MKLNIIKRELRANFKSSLIWIICMVFFTLICVVKFDAGTGTVNYNDLLNKVPKLIQSFFGFSGLDLSIFIEYVGVCYIFLLLLASIYSATLGSSIVAKEVRDKTSEFLLVKPVKRYQILISKITVSVIYVVIYNLISFSVLLLLASSKGEMDKDIIPVFLLFTGMVIVSLIFLLMGTMLACVLRDSKKSVNISMGIIFGFYVATSVFDMLELPSFLKFLIPFQYFRAFDIIKGSGISVLYVIISLAIIAITACLAFRRFKNRDMNI